MDERTLTALKKSIEHWRENVRAEEFIQASVRRSDCALCQEFWAKTGICAGCPVNEVSGDGCQPTPYEYAAEVYFDWEEDCSFREDFILAAQAELDFLIGLLPEGER